MSFKNMFSCLSKTICEVPYMSDVKCAYMKSLAAAFENFLNLRQTFSSNRIAHLMLSFKLCCVEKCMSKLSFGSVFCSFSVGNDPSETHDHFLFLCVNPASRLNSACCKMSFIERVLAIHTLFSNLFSPKGLMVNFVEMGPPSSFPTLNAPNF